MRHTRVGSVRERFFDRFEVDSDTGCWNWTGPLHNSGYGVIAGEIDGKRYVKKGQQMLTHRVSWLLHFGDIPDSDEHHGMVVMHTCDNRKCVNPDHLRLGTQSDNVKDMIQKGRKVAGDWQTRKGVEHFRSAFKDQADIDFICSTKELASELAKRFGVAKSTINRIRKRNRAA